MATRIHILSLWLTALTTPAWASDPPDAALAWAAMFDGQLPQYKQISQQYSEPAPVGPGCAEPGDCSVLKHDAWALLVILEPQDRRRFSPATIRIHPLGERTPSEWIQRLQDHAAAPGRVSMAGLAAGPYWVELAIPCSMVNLLPYETQDLIEHIQKQQPTLTIHEQLAWSPCAKTRFETQNLSWVQAEAKVEREQWGIQLPQGRVIVEIPD